MKIETDHVPATLERQPDFFILGAPKCGTTTVFDWLREHPDTYLPRKEPNFLSTDVFDASDDPRAFESWEDYIANLNPEAADGKLTGEATPRYLYSDRALDTLSRSAQSVRFLVLLRNPVDLVYSLHGQMVKEGLETEADFETAWRRSLIQQGEPTAWVSAGRADHRLDYPLFGRIGSPLDRTLAMLGSERVKVMILEEELSTDPAGALREITHFLGLPEIVPPTLGRSNERYRMRSVALWSTLIRLRSPALGLLRRMGVRTGKGAGTGIMKAMERFNRVDERPPQRLGEALRAEIADYFRAEVALTERLLGREIRAWKDFHAPGQGGFS